MIKDKYQYIEYKKLSDAVRDFEDDEIIFTKRAGRWMSVGPHHSWHIQDSYAKRVLKLEPRYETLHEGTDNVGNIGLYDKHGRYPMFEVKRFSPNSCEGLQKTGRTFKLNLDTWEIEL